MPLRVPPKVLKDKKALSDYVHKHIFPKVSQAHRDYLAHFFTEIFSDGFESGDFSAWTGISVDAGCSMAVVDTEKHHGTYSAESYVDNEDDYALVHKTISSATTCFMRTYVKFANLTSTTNQEGAVSPRLRGGGSTKVNVYLVKTATSFRWELWLVGSRYASAEMGVTVDQWYCLETKFVASTTVGEGRLWVDGVEVVTQTGKNTGTTGIDDVYVGLYSSPGALGYEQTAYYDCVVVADAYIGPEAEVTVKTVTDSLSLTDSVLRNKTFSVSDVLGLSDVILRNKTLVITDSVGANDAVLGNKSPLIVADAVSLSELINVITEAMLKTVTDQVSLSDGAKVLKQLGVSDAVTLVDGVNVTERILRVLDAVTLADTLHVNKFLQVTEAISLAEVVQVGVEGVKKTKLFLILGELAVQLTGD